MYTKMYVGNLSYAVEHSELGSLLNEYGPVVMVNIVNDRDSEKVRGFGFTKHRENRSNRY